MFSAIANMLGGGRDAVSKAGANSIARRCVDDEATRMRLHYKPYYHTFEAQRGSRVVRDGREFVMLASNDYLGLTHHPKVLEAGRKALETWGASTTGARLANGSRVCHVELEERLAAFMGKEACHVSAAGYLSCMSAIQPFSRKGDLVLADKNCHSSLLAGIQAGLGENLRFSHNSPESLAELLAEEAPERPKMVVLEGVYSMEGHIARLPEILRVCEGRNCFFVMDDAHGLGVLGPGGRGTAAHFGSTDSVDLICGSLSKALASTGGFVAGSRPIIEFLRTHSKQTIFSASLAPVQVACALAALDVLETEPECCARLWENTRRYKEILADFKFDTWGSETPAVPIVLGSRERTYIFWQKLLENGVFAVPSLVPAVPPGKDLIRTAVSARHSTADFDIIAKALKAAKSLW
ncbi:MAG: pyridoxal phosphate-dependent aminotransferase family protein [Puniceicoccales bacterium]|jgi:7-keto-8-aminopelargonate synthetase-like enzyme|nr:pyridoxal phosphate-dependent aminotransferase family protein [Puniceicoccales bacterium]